MSNSAAEGCLSTRRAALDAASRRGFSWNGAALSALVASIVWFAFATAACAQDSLGVRPGMSYDEVKAYVAANQDLVYQEFGPSGLKVADVSRGFVPNFNADILFCPGSTYDGKAITIITSERFSSENATQGIARYHELFAKMAGDQLGEVLSTRTEGDEARRNGTVGVSIKHRLKNGEIWDLGLFNRREKDEHFIQLIRTISPDAACKR